MNRRLVGNAAGKPIMHVQQRLAFLSYSFVSHAVRPIPLSEQLLAYKDYSLCSNTQTEALDMENNKTYNKTAGW